MIVEAEVPDVPLDPVLPELPEVPEVPDVPELPSAPGSPLSPVVAKHISTSSALLNIIPVPCDDATASISSVHQPALLVRSSIANSIKSAVLNFSDILT